MKSIEIGGVGILGSMAKQKLKVGDVSDSDSSDEDDVLMKALPMAQRREMREQVRASRTNIRNEHQQSQAATKKKMGTLTGGCRNFFYFVKNFRLWKGSLYKIESRFGSAVVAYFQFLKWTMILNVVSTLFIVGLIVVPQLVADQEDPFLRRPNKTRDCISYDKHWYARDNASECCSNRYQERNEDHEGPSQNFFDRAASRLEALLLGTGWIEDSELFYGHYSGTFVFQFGSASFDFPLAYFLVMIFLLILNLAAIVVASSRSFFIGNKYMNSASCRFNNLVFGGWNCMVTKYQGVTCQRSDVTNRLIGMVDNREKKLERQQMERRNKNKLIMVRVLINLFILALLASAFYGLYFLVAEFIPDLLLNDQFQCSIMNTDYWVAGIICIIFEYIPSLAITIGNTILPMIFNFLVQFEKYDTNTELMVTLSRCIFVKLASLIITFFSIFTTISCNYGTGCLDSEGTVTATKHPGIIQECVDPGSVPVTVCSNDHVFMDFCRKPICWETFVGQEFYKLAVMDFLVQFSLVFFFDLPRVKIFGCCKMKLCSFLGTIEFGIAKNALDVVYSQAICWLAMFYAPLITVVTVVKSFLIFYIRMFYVLYVRATIDFKFNIYHILLVKKQGNDLSQTSVGYSWKKCLWVNFSEREKNIQRHLFGIQANRKSFKNQGAQML